MILSQSLKELLKTYEDLGFAVSYGISYIGQGSPELPAKKGAIVYTRNATLRHADDVTELADYISGLHISLYLPLADSEANDKAEELFFSTLQEKGFYFDFVEFDEIISSETKKHTIDVY